jgi:hypothetical protein
MNSVETQLGHTFQNDDLDCELDYADGDADADAAKSEKKSRMYRRSFYTVELVNVTSSISAINKFILLHPEFFKTNINKKIVYFNDNHIYSIYTEPLWFKDSIHKINGYITTEIEKNFISMKIHINKNLKNKECYVKQIEKYINHQTKYGNNVELNYYKILSDTIIKHCYYNEPIEQWNGDVSLVQNEFFSPHKQYLFSIINNKVKNNGVGNTANSWNNLILHGIPGSGKCLGIDTEVVMYNNTVKKVQNIGVGELVLGDDYTPRQVLALSSGEDELFEVTHSGSDSYVVNSRHILSLSPKKGGCIIDMPIKEYMALSQSNKENLCGFKLLADEVKQFMDTRKRTSGFGIIREDIKVRPIGRGKYYGFELDKNHRFVLGNYIVTHNSSCIYRISMMLKLSIISVDISLYLNKKKELYSLFHGQEFCLPSSNTKESAISNAIIVLEEFDHAMDKLLDIENIFKYKDIIKREYLNMKNKEIKMRTQELIEEYDQKTAVVATSEEKTDRDDFSKKLKNIKKMVDSGEDVNYDKFVELEMLEDGFDTQNNRVHDKARQNVLKKRDFDNEICGINAELNNIIRNMDDDNKSNILRLSDMLELFQGPVPIKNRIVMATTNNFEKIKNALPALFRSGRMSPIHFDYLDWKSLNELCMYYFNQQLTCEPHEVTIPTSQIIELAIKHVLTEKKFEDFQAELIGLM